MKNNVILSLITLLVIFSSVAKAVDTKQLDTQFSINEIVNSYYSFDICIPKHEGIISSTTIVYWDGTKNLLTVHPESHEYNGAWLHSNILFQAHNNTHKITVSVDFNLENGKRIKTESYTLSAVTKDFKNRGLITPTGQQYIVCSSPRNSKFGEIHSFITNNGS